MIRIKCGYIEHDTREITYVDMYKHSLGGAALLVQETRPKEWTAFEKKEDVTAEVLLYVQHLNAAKEEIRAHNKQQIRRLADKRAPRRDMEQSA